MAVAVDMLFSGATLAQYDEVIKLMGLEPGGPGPAGSISHWVAEVPGGIRVVDVWPSQADFESFAQSSIGPMTAKVGMSPPTTTDFIAVHNHFTAG